MKIEDNSELIALQKALNFIKFGEDQEDKIMLCGSPHISKLLQQVTNALIEHYRKYVPTFSGEWGNIEEAPHILHQIKKNIDNMDNWNNNTNDMKKKIIIEFCSPYSIKEETINSFL